MGYMVSSLAELPVDEGVEFYIFAVTHKWQGDVSELLERNFGLIAEKIGSENILVKGFEEQWERNVLSAYFGDEQEELRHLLPGLLITDAHPNHLTDKSLRILVSLNKVKGKFGNFDHFFSSLTDFVQGHDTDFLSLIEEKDDYLRKVAKMLDLKPNFCGIGINLNEIIEQLLNIRERKKRH